MGVFQGKISGSISSRIGAQGTKSEGPIYFLRPNDEHTKFEEVPIIKPVHLWEKDMFLEEYLGKTVTLVGEITETKDTISIEYSEIIYEGRVFKKPELPKETELSSEEIKEKIRFVVKNEFKKE
jgi:hypothetical protein